MYFPLHSSQLLGTSSWLTHEGSNDHRDLQNIGSNFYFGRSLYGQRGRLITPLRRHIITAASTRSGKNTDLITPNALCYSGSLMAIDPKGELAYVAAPRRRALGQKVHILDPFGEVNRRYGKKSGEIEDVATYNPLSILDPTSEYYTEDLTDIAESLIIKDGKDPYWEDSAEEVVAGYIAYRIEKPGIEATLPLVRSMLTEGLDTLVETAIEAQGFGEESLARRKLQRFATVNRSKENKGIEGILLTALTQTSFLDSPTLAKSLSSSSFSFESLVNNDGASIFLVIPVDRLQTYGRWFRMMVSVGIRTVARNTGKLEHPVLLLLDEFGCVGKLSTVSQAIGLMAGFNLRLWVVIQDFLQLKRDYPEDWESFIANSDAVTFFNGMDQFSCEYISKLLGKNNHRKDKSHNSNATLCGLFSNPFYSDMADQFYSRDLLQPSEIRRLPDHLGIFIFWRGYPVLFEKVKYFEDPFFSNLARENPYHRRPEFFKVGV